jgi:hypothetical protein
VQLKSGLVVVVVLDVDVEVVVVLVDVLVDMVVVVVGHAVTQTPAEVTLSVGRLQHLAGAPRQLPANT